MAQGLAGEDPRAAEVAEGVKELGVVLGLSRLYGPRHVRTERAARDALAHLHQLLERYGAIELSTDVEGFFWRDALVYRDLEDGRGFGRLLHDEGIRRLVLEPAIGVDALLDLFEALGKNLALDEHMEETLELLLWQADMRGISFQAVSELSEAELLSGRLAQDGSAALDAYERDARVAVGGEDPRLLRLRELLDEDAAGAGAGRARPEVDETVPELDAPELAAALASDEHDDGHSARDLRRKLDRVHDSELAARLCTQLVRAVEAGSPDVPADEGLARAHDALDALYRERDVAGLVRLFADGAVLGTSEGDAQLRDFLSRAGRPRKIVRMLAGLDARDASAIARGETLVRVLPDDTLQAVLEGIAYQRKDADVEPAIELISRVAGGRIAGWLADARHHSVEGVVPMIAILRVDGEGRGREHRAELLTHPSPLVRAAAVEWCADDAPEELFGALRDALLDRDRAVRRQANLAVRRYRNPESLAWFLERLDGAALDALGPDERKDFATTFGRTVGEAAVAPLIERLGKGAPVLAGSRSRRVLEEVALALAATGAPRAMNHLRLTARSWRPAQSTACRQALAASG